MEDTKPTTELQLKVLWIKVRIGFFLLISLIGGLMWMIGYNGITVNCTASTCFQGSAWSWIWMYSGAIIAIIGLVLAYKVAGKLPETKK